MRVALWSVTDGVPVRLEQGHSFVEADLEQWVERDATLVLDGLRWIGRQVTLPDRSRVDLVGLTREGQLVVAELKRGVLDTATLMSEKGSLSRRRAVPHSGRQGRTGSTIRAARFGS